MMIKPIRDHRHASGGNRKETLNIGCGFLAHCNDLVLAMREMLHGYPSVEHPEPIVFTREAKRREIVDRRNQCAWATPHHPAVTRDMQDVQSKVAGELRQRELVPRDVAHGWPHRLRNRHNLHLVSNKREEGNILFQHKENILVRVIAISQCLDERENVLAHARTAALNDRGGDSDSHEREFSSARASLSALEQQLVRLRQLENVADTRLGPAEEDFDAERLGRTFQA